ncbi:gamma-aminobutyric acid receptor subunit rho-1-like [Branchiostoma floridae]|uniref:Gamma-aminobutyric acid receptor subunit rho-1-like n=1 Tax=Branchiostoma floridae TaxID=7739 RepID=A0A9J7LAY1_BRAFL|nr:gamma-aminobutyric acid receptor subunit rho-1-like [Branchiostoma floridae]
MIRVALDSYCKEGRIPNTMKSVPTIVTCVALTLLSTATSQLTTGAGSTASTESAGPSGTVPPTLSFMTPPADSTAYPTFPEGYRPWDRPLQDQPVDVSCMGRVDSSRALSCAQVFIVGARGNRQSVETRAHGENTSGSTIMHNDFSLSLIMGCEWRDFRLANMSSDSWSPPPEMHIWKPSIEVVMKEESGESHPVVSVSPEGNVLQMRWYTLKVTCLMQLQAYPLDRQKCSVLFNILGGARILWGWSTYWFPGATPVVTRTSGLHSQLQLETVETFAYVNSLVLPEAICVYEGGACDYGETENCLRKQCTSVERITSQECRTCNYFSGVCHNGTVQDCDSLQAVTQGDQVFTTGELRFTLTRRLSYHLLQTYIPSISIVAMSWISFWLNKDAAPARTALGVTTVLTMITQSGRTEAMPEVSYVRAVDVWLLVCQLFVFLALIEYASVNYISRTIRAKVEKPSEPTENCSFFKMQEDCQNQNHLETPVKVTKMDGRQIAEKIDEISKMLFPLSFLLFNLLYWSVYFFVVR